MTTRPANLLPLVCTLVLCVNTHCWSAPVQYETQIKPILKARCYACHGALKQEGGLRLDTARSIAQGGDSGPAIQPSAAAESLLLARVSADDEAERMPPEGEPLTPEQLAMLRAWIAAGGEGPADERPEPDPREHWSFQNPVRPAVPVVQNAAWVAQPVDAFLLAELESRGLAPQAAADKRTWLRRVYLDLIGLPPTLNEQAAFVADESPEAYARVVDRLLESPQYGERWGRHFMDIWRYSDWWGLGAEVRNSQKHIWHWRDWIIESLQQDKGYDQMIREMLAADELYPNDLDRLRASGYLARQYFKFNRTTWLDETIEHTAKGFLGLTFNCSKCHDHKYDPISQKDYYRLRAFFEPYQVRTEMRAGTSDYERDGIPRAFDCNLDAPTYLHIRGDDRNPDTSEVLLPGLPQFLAVDGLPITAVALPAEAAQPGLRPFVLETLLQDALSAQAAAAERVTKAEQELATAEQAAGESSATAESQAAVEQARLALQSAQTALAAAAALPDTIRARAAADRAKVDGTAETAAELARAAALAEKQGARLAAEAELARLELELAKAPMDQRMEAEKKRDAARTALENAQQAAENPGEAYTSLRGALKTLESNLEKEESRSKPFPATSTGRRTALAEWIASNGNPLTARVVVNHVWMRHMGQPLVPTVFDFGRKGTPPTHPELLDWLAVEFMEHDWSLKHLHRQIVLSNAYRQSSSNRYQPAFAATADPHIVDPENRFFWRANPLRMEAEVVRDSLLHLAGELDNAVGGPTIPAKDQNSRRRSLYFFHSNNEEHLFLAMFDHAKVQECYRRAESVVPQQALALENSQLAFRSAERIAAELSGRAADATEREFLNEAFLTVLAVTPSPEELQAAERALAEWRSLVPAGDAAAVEARVRTLLVHALLNHNDFVTIR